MDGREARAAELDRKIAAFGKGIAALLERIPLPEKEAPALQKALKQSQKGYGEAIRHLFRRPELRPVGLKIFQVFEKDGLEASLQALSAEDVATLEREAEALMQQGKARLSGQIFQFLTLFSSGDNPNLYAFLMLAEEVANTDLAAAAKIYNFLVSLFPRNPALLLSAAECHRDAGQPERALELLKEAEISCSGLGERADKEALSGTLEEIRDLMAAVRQRAAAPG